MNTEIESKTMTIRRAPGIRVRSAGRKVGMKGRPHLLRSARVLQLVWREPVERIVVISDQQSGSESKERESPDPLLRKAKPQGWGTRCIGLLKSTNVNHLPTFKIRAAPAAL